ALALRPRKIARVRTEGGPAGYTHPVEPGLPGDPCNAEVREIGPDTMDRFRDRIEPVAVPRRLEAVRCNGLEFRQSAFGQPHGRQTFMDVMIQPAGRRSCGRAMVTSFPGLVRMGSRRVSATVIDCPSGPGKVICMELSLSVRMLKGSGGCATRRRHPALGRCLRQSRRVAVLQGSARGPRD